jgi:hypothetical protein
MVFINGRISEQINTFNYLGYIPSCGEEKDLRVL